MLQTNSTEHVARSSAPLLTELEAADYLKVSIRTLQNWRHRGGGPKYTKLNNRMVRYRISQLEAWLDAQAVANTSDACARLGM